MKFHSWIHVLCAATPLTLLPAAALGAPTPQDVAAAEALFQEARAHMDAGETELACPKFVASQRLDPTPGTMLNIGECYERLGRTASAWGAFIEAEALARKAADPVREQEATRRARLLEGKLSRVRIVVPAERHIPGLTVLRDGQPVQPELWGTEVPLDPGRYRIEATAPGRRRWSTILMLAGHGNTTTVEIPPLPASATQAADPAPRAPANGLRTAAWVVGGIGLAGAVVGSAFGVRAIVRNTDAGEHCRGGEPKVCTAEGLSLHDDAVTSANISNVAFAIGSAAVTASVVLFLAAPPAHAAKNAATLARKRKDLQVALGSDGQEVTVRMRGRW